MGRKSIGLIYTPSTDWIAGAYYVQNIVHALNTLDDKDKPRIWVYCNKCDDFIDLKIQSKYPYMKRRLISPPWIKYYSLLRRALRKLIKIDLGDLERYPMRLDRVKFVYPFSSMNWWQTQKDKCLGWIPDFQEKYLMELFSKENLISRNRQQKSFIENNVPLVFSSYDAQQDFFRFHPDGRNLKTFVMHFAVKHPDYSNEDIDELKNKFHISKRYIFCANQFWAHKNHLFLFRVFQKAKSLGFDMQLICSGKLSDYRDKGYSQRISTYISENHLENDIRILGFIERTEQLCLMKHSYAIVQPSLFEGWSTVVEDAKCLNKFIFLSNLKVHQEQIQKNVCFFDPKDEEDLLVKLMSTKPTVDEIDYSSNLREAGRQMKKIIDEF